MKTIKDISNKEIRDFFGCTNVQASRIKSGVRSVPRKRIVEFSKHFGIPIEVLLL